MSFLSFRHSSLHLLFYTNTIGFYTDDGGYIMATVIEPRSADLNSRRWRRTAPSSTGACCCLSFRVSRRAARSPCRHLLSVFRRSPPCIYTHLKKLVDAGVLERVTIENEIRYTIKNFEEISDLIITYKNTFFDKQIEPVMKFLIKYDKIPLDSDKDRIDGLINLIYEIFPHPYYV